MKKVCLTCRNEWEENNKSAFCPKCNDIQVAEVNGRILAPTSKDWDKFDEATEIDFEDIINNKYERIYFSVSETIDEAVKELLSYKEKGVLVYGTFNRVPLFSDTVTIDSAYKDTTGQTKAEFDEFLAE